MGPLILRSRISRSRGVLALTLVVSLGFLVALHHGEAMPMDHGDESGGASVEMAGTMICLGVLALGAVALAPSLGGRLRAALPLRRIARPSYFPRPVKIPRDRSRAGPSVSQVFRL